MGDGYVRQGLVSEVLVLEGPLEVEVFSPSPYIYKIYLIHNIRDRDIERFILSI